MAEELIRLRGSGPRPVAAVTSLAVLGLLLLWLATVEGMAPFWRVIMVVFGACGLWTAWEVRRATAKDLVLTREGLFDADGRELALIENIAAVKRGVFEVKPPSGFLIKLRTQHDFGWAPGVWWRFGHRIGIGGAVSGVEAKALAEMLELVIADRDGLLQRFDDT